MRRIIIAPVITVAALVMAACTGGNSASGELTISNATVRPLLPGRDVTAAHMIISGGAEGDVLLSARSNATDAIELHISERVDNVARMRMLDRIEVPAGGEVVLEQGGLHLMLFGLDEAEIADGLPVVLEFERAGEISTVLELGSN